jgi:hypothetical protein
MHASPGSSVKDQLDAMFEEYRALYGIALLRMTALDRRVPVTAGAMAVAIAALDVVSEQSQLLLLLSVPLALVWFVRATVNHARSFEDVLRRIEEIETTVNGLFSKPVINFQSRHPSRGRHVGGRTGQESVAAVLATSLLVLAAAGYRMWRAQLLPAGFGHVYVAVLGLVGILILREGVRLSQYRYEPSLNLAEGTR